MSIELPTCVWSDDPEDDDGMTSCGAVAYGVIEDMPACDKHRGQKNGLNWDVSPYATRCRELQEEHDKLKALALAVLQAANPSDEPWRCEHFAALAKATKG